MNAEQTMHCLELIDEHLLGICMACNMLQACTEPDAIGDFCDQCGQNMVNGHFDLDALERMIPLVEQWA